MTNIIIKPMAPREAIGVARLHSSEITQGFISRLGPTFLRQLYLAIARDQGSFVLVAIGCHGRLVGFISGTTDVKGMYRRVLIRHGWMLAWILMLRPASWFEMGRIMKTLRYPSQSTTSSPDAELLAVAVEKAVRGHGVASALLEALISEFRRRKCKEFKVLVGSELGRARAFYQKHQFRMFETVEGPSGCSCIYVRSS